jgi:hypothetical protein
MANHGVLGQRSRREHGAGQALYPRADSALWIREPMFRENWKGLVPIQTPVGHQELAVGLLPPKVG